MRKSYQTVPDGLHVEKEPYIDNPSKKFLDAWRNQLEVTRSNLRDVLLEEYVEKYFELELKTVQICFCKTYCTRRLVIKS